MSLDTKRSKRCREVLDQLFRLYCAADATIVRIDSDEEFKHLMDSFRQGVMPCEHTRSAERNNRTAKERVRAGYFRLPYNKLPRVLSHELVCDGASKLNMFQVKGAVIFYYT